MNSDYQQLPHGITRIDTHYTRPGLAAAYLLEKDGQALFIETGPQLAVPRLLQALPMRGLTPEDVVAIIVTHVHLDHAGGAGRLLEHLPNARLFVHAKGARHLIDPAKLEASAKVVYGEPRYAEILGGVTPADASRVVSPEDEERFSLNGRELIFIDAPGHARHHLCVWDSTSQGIFSGDALGISYREFDNNLGRFIFPATTPVQFDPEASHQTIDRLAALHPSFLHLTHFGSIPYHRFLMKDLHRQLEQYTEQALAIRADGQGDTATRLLAVMQTISQQRIQVLGSRVRAQEAARILAMDWEVNVAGLECWLNQLEQKKS